VKVFQYFSLFLEKIKIYFLKIHNFTNYPIKPFFSMETLSWEEKYLRLRAEKDAISKKYVIFISAPPEFEFHIPTPPLTHL